MLLWIEDTVVGYRDCHCDVESIGLTSLRRATRKMASCDLMLAARRNWKQEKSLWGSVEPVERRRGTIRMGMYGVLARFLPAPGLHWGFHDTASTQ